MKFSELKLENTLQMAIDKLNYEECTPIQVEAIPPIMEGKDLAGLAQTGTGKTAAFLIPLMERILRTRSFAQMGEEEQVLYSSRCISDWKSQNFVLILVPTRELAEQVYENVQKLSEFSGLRGYPIYGGVGYDKQKEALQNHLDFVVATPGRLIDLYKEHFVDLKQVKAVVFDEADRMFDMGFKEDMKYILQRIPRERQFLVFSATLNLDVLNTAYQFGAQPVEINISKDEAKADNVKDSLLHVGQDEKPQQLLSLLKHYKPRQVIVFTNFKLNVERLARFLNHNDLPAVAISSMLNQTQRNRVLEQFKAENDHNILVATDLAARGLDIKGVDMVINYELPNDAESYVHRIGRTGRAGAQGLAFALVGDKDIDSLNRIEEFLKHKVPIHFLENDQIIVDFHPMTYESEHSSQGSSRGGNGRHGGSRRTERPEHSERGSDSRRREGPAAGAGRRSSFEGSSARGEESPSRKGSGGPSAGGRGPRAEAFSSQGKSSSGSVSSNGRSRDFGSGGMAATTAPRGTKKSAMASPQKGSDRRSGNGGASSHSSRPHSHRSGPSGSGTQKGRAGSQRPQSFLGKVKGFLSKIFG